MLQRPYEGGSGTDRFIVTMKTLLRRDHLLLLNKPLSPSNSLRIFYQPSQQYSLKMRWYFGSNL